VLIPAAPGALSALGILDADLRREFSRTVMLAPDSARIRTVFEELEAEARATFRNEGVVPNLTRAADLRYEGQGFELRVDWRGRVIKNFHDLHERSYGYSDPGRRIEVVTVRLLAVARTPRPRQAPAKLRRGNGDHARISVHPIYEEGRWRRGALYDRARLRPGDRLAGPAVIVELSATTYLPTGWSAAVDGFGNLLLVASEAHAKGGRR
jgi:N-methylhydantoinase A